MTPDVGTGLAILGGGAVSKEVVGKLLGPTADYIGEGLQSWTERRIENVQNVFGRAARRLPQEQLDRGGQVPPRVLKAVLEEAQVAEDELMSEYLGGVLASSRSETGRDDRAAALAALIGRLSTYELRSHYIVYAAARRYAVGSGANLGISQELTSTVGPLYLPLSAYLRALDASEEETNMIGEIIHHTVLSLTREGLIGAQYAFGSIEHLAQAVPPGRTFPEVGMVVEPTQLGIHLFVAAHGVREFRAFTDASQAFAIEPPIDDAGIVRLSDLPLASGE